MALLWYRTTESLDNEAAEVGAVYGEEIRCLYRSALYAEETLEMMCRDTDGGYAAEALREALEQVKASAARLRTVS